MRAASELAAAQDTGRPVTAETIATAQAIPLKFLENILQGLRHAGVVESGRGADGGHLLARPAGEITLADVIRAIDGPLAAVGGRYPEDLGYCGTAEPLLTVWVAVRQPAAGARGGHSRSRGRRTDPEAGGGADGGSRRLGEAVARDGPAPGGS